MNCPNCGSINAPNSPFCVHCGSPLARLVGNPTNTHMNEPVQCPMNNPVPVASQTSMPQTNVDNPPQGAYAPPAYPQSNAPYMPAAQQVQPQPQSQPQPQPQQPYPPTPYQQAPMQERYADAAQPNPGAYGQYHDAGQYGYAQVPAPQQPAQQHAQQPARQYASLRDAAEAMHANEPSMQGQPQYYAPQQPQQPVRQPQNNGVNVQDVKAGLTDAAQNIVGKAKKGFKNKKIFGGIAAAVAILAIICVVGWLFGNNNGFVATKAHITPIVVDGEVRIMVDNKLLEDTIDGKSVDAGSSSLNGKVVAFTTDENILYVVNGKKVTKVAEDVLSCQVSTSGKGVAYLTDADEGYSLNLYKVSGGKDTKVSDDVGSYSFAISPDGKSVAYFVDGDDHNELMYFKGSESVKIASEEVALLGLSNSGKQIYVTRKDDNGENIVYSYNTKGEKEKLGKTDDYAVYFNEKHTEIMFFNEGKTYIAAKGKEGVKMSSDELHLVVAPNASTNSDGAAYTYPVSSLFNHVYLSRDDDGMNAWMIKKNPDKNVKLASDVSNVTLDKSGKYLYYVHDGEELMVLKVSDGDKASNKAVELADDVSTYVVESGRGKVYYVSDGELYSVNGKKGGKPKEIADEIDGYSLAISAKNVVFYISDGDLYACSNGKSGERALSDCSAVSNTCNGVIYAIDDDAIYASKGSKKVEKVAELDS